MPQAPVEVEGEEEYIVEEILDSHLRHNKLEFLVKWEGYTDENNSWKLEDNCKNVRNVRATLSNIPKWVLCGLYKNSGSGEMRLMG